LFKTKNIFLITLLTLCLSIGMVHCEFGKSLRYAKAPNGEDIICVYRFGMVESCYPKVFKATAEYQTLLEGQEIPKGLDVQINMRTGERRAKLSDAMIQQQKVQQLLEQQETEEQKQRRAEKQKLYEELLQRKAQQQKLDELLQRKAEYEEYLKYKAQQQKLDEYLQRRAQQQQFEEYLERQAQQQQYEEYLQKQLQKQKYREYLQQEARKQQYREYIKQQQEIEQQRYNDYIEKQQQLQKQKYEEYLKEQAIREKQHEEYLKKLREQPQVEAPEEKSNEEEKQVHEIVMVKPKEGENEEGTKTQKVQIHAGKYKSSESPRASGLENVEEKEDDNDSEDSDDDTVVKIHYQDKVSYTEAFGSLFKANTLEEKIEVLEQLEDIVHHIEFGQELMRSLPEFLKFLDDENPKVRALASICIGSALQNNPKARKVAIKQNLYDTLIERLTKEDDITVLKRLCFAFSNFVRGDTNMIKKLHESKNLGLLYHLYVNKPALRSKLETFITDIFDQEKMKEGTKLEEFVDKESAQLWCSVFQNNIISNEGYIPDSLNSLSIMLDAGQCLTINPDLRHVLKDLPKTQPELFEDTLDLNNNIQKILNYQGPQQQQSFKEL